MSIGRRLSHPRCVAAVSHNDRMPRLAVATTFPVHPRLGGGQVRVYNLYRQLARWFDIEIVSLGAHHDVARVIKLAPGLRETTVPKTRAHDEAERLLEIECGHVVTDIAMADLYRLTPEYLDALGAAAAGVRAVIASHPFTLDAIHSISAAPLWYEAQDVEYTMKASLLHGARGAEPLLVTVERVERTCRPASRPHSIWVCSTEDRDELTRRYGADPARMAVVPDGADLDGRRFTDGERRRRLQAQLRLGERMLAVFVASWHPPNIEAAQAILALAERVPAIDFLILGSVGLAFTDGRIPKNAQLVGPVSPQFEQDALAVADAALNPVTSGSGTNLKMLDYFACGVPVISTGVGARGLSVLADRHYLQAEPEGFRSALRRLASMEPGDIDAMTAAARSHVETTLSWEAVAHELMQTLYSFDAGEPAPA